MKRKKPLWTKRKGKVDPNMPQDEKKFFDEIDLKKKDGDPKLEVELNSNGYFEWAKYPLTKHYGKKAQRKYEALVGGFLYFYDMELEQYPEKFKAYYDKQNIDVSDCYEKLKSYINNKLKLGLQQEQEHKIFFEWYQKEKDNAFMRIYINPPAGNPDPPRPPGPPPPESSE